MLTHYNGVQRIQCPWCPIGLRRSLFPSASALGQHAAAKHPEKLGDVAEEGPNKRAAYTDRIKEMFPHLGTLPNPCQHSVAAYSSFQRDTATSPDQVHLDASAAPSTGVNESAEPSDQQQRQQQANPTGSAPMANAAAAADGTVRLGCQPAPASVAASQMHAQVAKGMPTAAALELPLPGQQGSVQTARLLDQHNLGAFSGQPDELLSVLFSHLPQESLRELRLVNKYFAGALCNYHVKQAGWLGVCLAALYKLLPSMHATAAAVAAAGSGAGLAATASPAVAAADDQSLELLPAFGRGEAGVTAAAAADNDDAQQQQQQQGAGCSLYRSLKVTASVVHGSRTYEVSSIERDWQQQKFVEELHSRNTRPTGSKGQQQGLLDAGVGIETQAAPAVQAQGLVQELERQQQIKQQLLNWLAAAPAAAASSNSTGSTINVYQVKLEGLLEYVIPRRLASSAALAAVEHAGFRALTGNTLDLTSIGVIPGVNYAASGVTAEHAPTKDNLVTLYVQITAGSAAAAARAWQQLIHDGLAGWLQQALPEDVSMSVALSYIAGGRGGSKGLLQYSRLKVQGGGRVLGRGL